MVKTMKKKLIPMIACLAAAAIFAGCTNSAQPASGGSEGSTNEKALKIAIVTSGGGVDDGSFNQDNYNGVLSFIADHPSSTVTPVQEATGDSAAALQAVQDVVGDYDALVLDGFQFAALSEIANDNPGKNFILVDTFPSDVDGNEITLDNVYAMSFKEEEGGFLAGVAAALSTKTNKVAVVNGIAFPSNVNYQYGFMSGVNYSNKHFGTKAECVELASYAGTDVTGKNVGGNYVGSFGDPANGKVVGDALIKEGCDIIFVAAGASGNGVFTAVKESSAEDFVIGCDTDQYNDGANGDKNIVLTSTLKIMGKNDKRVLGTVLDGTFKGGNYTLGADTDSIGFVSEAGRHQLTDDAVEKINKAYDLIKNGTVVPASNFNGYMPDNFKGIDAE